MIIGVDEVGRGCLAGPVAAGAVILSQKIRGLKDSKLLTREQRTKFDARIRQRALGFGVGWASVEEVNALGLTEAVRLAMHRAVDEVLLAVDAVEQLIVDGNYNYFANHRLSPVSQALIKADQLVPAVSAASIIAKVARDLHMTGLAPQYPGFGFESHVGYATPAHRRALRELGATNIHRINFRQVREAVAASDKR
ncbi:MAG: ribonuclease HII [Candidatus Saccharimonadales bacterium]